MRIWPSWIRAVSDDGTCKQMSANVARKPPPFPVIANAYVPISRALLIAEQTLELFPDVEMPTSKIACPTESLYLAGENVIVSIIVADRRQNGAVCCQSNRGQTLPLPAEPSNQLSRQMLTIRFTSPISAPKHHMPGLKGVTYAGSNDREKLEC